METDAIKTQQWILSNLLQKLETLGLENAAYRKALATDSEAQTRVSALRNSLEFASLLQQYDAIRNQAVQAVARQDNAAMFEAIGDLLGQLDRW
jgi:hypothetical protein